MTIGQYLLLAAVTYPSVGFCCYYFIYKPAKRKMTERYSAVESEDQKPDTEYYTGKLYRLEGRQVLVIPAECELSVSRIKVRRLPEALVIYPRDITWSKYADLLPANSTNVSERPDANNEEDKP